MLKSRFPIIISLFFLIRAAAAQPELRGVWIAWGGANPPQKTTIARMMDNLAEHNVNTVYVDVWRYGYPYFRSQVFHDLTGLWTDPALEEGRDILAEMIAEGHRVGLHVEAWFEYGFVACHNNNDDLFRVHPEWFAQHRNGSYLFNSNLNWKWLSHANPAAQQFLIDLCQEVVQRYDVDGIELDRIRYPELDCGYDPVTVALYKSDHGGAAPPVSPSEPGWMQWRAEKLTAFVAAFYDSIKILRPDVFISNAPISYSYGYANFCQDWRPWINTGALDFVSTQLYWPTNTVYVSELDRQLTYVNDRSKFYPGICSIANDIIVSGDEIVKMIQSTRHRNLRGHVIWFYDQIADDLPLLKEKVYQERVPVPDRPADWRQPAIIINEDAPGASRSEGWTSYSGIPGYDAGCYYCKSDGARWIEYATDIPESGWYELYVYNIYQFKASKRAPYTIHHAGGVDTVLVNQAVSGQARWFKVGDYYLRHGAAQTVLRLSNAGIEKDAILFADAVMLVRSRRPLGTPSRVEARANHQPQSWCTLVNYPNPFNARTAIEFRLPNPAHVRLRIYDRTGREVVDLFNGRCQAGARTVIWDTTGLVSGLYFVQLQYEGKALAHKMLLIN